MTQQAYLRTALAVSAALHLGILGSALRWSEQGERKEDTEKEEKQVVAFSLSAAEAAAEEPAEEQPRPFSNLSEPLEAAASIEADHAFEVVAAGDRSQMVWTPPPPEPLKFTKRPVQQVEAADKIMEIRLPGNRQEPLLISFGAVAIDDDAVGAEVRRLGGYGGLVLAVEIDEEGVPAGCSVLESSGSNLLDTHGCEVVLEYRYEPARDGLGRPAYGRVEEALEWGEDLAVSARTAGEATRGELVAAAQP